MSDPDYRRFSKPTERGVDTLPQRVAVYGRCAVARILRDKRRCPPKYVGGQLHIERWELREAIHGIKTRSNVGATGRVIIYDDGNVTDENGEDIGNIYDEI